MIEIIPAHIVADGNAFFARGGVLLAAPILADNTVEWDEAVWVEDFENSGTDTGLLKQIAFALGL